MQSDNASGAPAGESPPSLVGPPVEVVRLKQGETIGARFVIDERLREDPLGSTYRAVDQKSGKRIALLMLDPGVATDRAATEGLRSHTRLMTSLAHKNVVSIFGLGKEGRRRYLAREYVDGQTLAELLEKKAEASRSFTLKGAYNLIAHVCNALQFAMPHLGHGTLRPSVILVNRTGRVKVSDFGLSALRPALLERRDHLNRWDMGCFPRGGGRLAGESVPERLGDEPDGDVAIDATLDIETARPSTAAAAVDAQISRDDLFALGGILFALVVGRPFNADPASLTPDVIRRMPSGLDAVLRRCFAVDGESAYRDANALKADLLAAVEAARGGDEADGEPLAGEASIVTLDEGRLVEGGGEAANAGLVAQKSGLYAPPPSRAAAKKPTKPLPAMPQAGGGFVIPELRPAAGATDDGTTQRWLVEKGGIDYGPFTMPQIVEKLRAEEIFPETNLYDIETDRRIPLSEHAVFDAALVSWLHERAELEKRRAEDARVASDKRRSRLVFGVAAAIVLTIGGVFAGKAAYEASLPTPVKAHLQALVAQWPGALPSINLPDEAAPETPAEIAARAKSRAAQGATRRAIDDQRQMAEEARLAASSTLDGTGGPSTGRTFDAGALDAAVATRNPQIVKCVQDEAKRDPNRRDFEIKATILPRGDIIQVRMTGGTAAGTACVRAALTGLKVPAFDGTNQALSLPFSIN